MTFNGWYDGYGNLVTTSQTGTILMDGPHILEAQSQPNYVVLGAGFVIIMVSLAISKRRSKVKSEDGLVHVYMRRFALSSSFCSTPL